MAAREARTEKDEFSMASTDSVKQEPNRLQALPVRHWVWPDERPNGRFEKSACGRWMHRSNTTNDRLVVTCRPCLDALVWANSVEI